MKLYSNVIPVRGHTRSMLCHLFNKNYYFIPNDLFDILNEFNGAIPKNTDWYKELSDKNKLVLEEYEKFLDKNDLINQWEDVDAFPELNLDWESPFQISNAIVDCFSPNLLNSFLEQLDKIGCPFIQFRLYEELSILEIERLVNSLEGYNFLAIELLLPFTNEIGEEKFTWAKEFVFQNPIIQNIIIHGCPESFTHVTDSVNKRGNILAVEENISSSSCCGVISKFYFSIDIGTFTESQKWNTCLNRKISIDVDGHIKNCPSMIESHGHISNTSLKEVVNKKEFQKYWGIKKDDIDKCRDCEFRHICTDCRAFREDPGDLYSKPLKCGYDPYSGEWSDWSNNPLKQKTIKFYEQKEMNEVQ